MILIMLHTNYVAYSMGITDADHQSLEWYMNKHTILNLYVLMLLMVTVNALQTL